MSGWGFHTDLVVADIDGNVWRVMLPLIYQAKDGSRHVVQAGFLTDLASTPRLLWRIYPKSGPWNPATVLHDDGYVKQEHSRAYYDALFREALEWLDLDAKRRGARTEEIKARTRRHFYWAVRLGGRGPWSHYAETNAREGDAA